MISKKDLLVLTDRQQNCTTKRVAFKNETSLIPLFPLNFDESLFDETLKGEVLSQVYLGPLIELHKIRKHLIENCSLEPFHKVIQMMDELIAKMIK